jgi:hypothetical protein
LLFVESNAPSSNATVGWSSIAPMELPHTPQKARLDHAEERHAEGTPPGPVHSTLDAGKSTHAAVRDPVCRWHSLHEQL